MNLHKSKNNPSFSIRDRTAISSATPYIKVTLPIHNSTFKAFSDQKLIQYPYFFIFENRVSNQPLPPFFPWLNLPIWTPFFSCSDQTPFLRTQLNNTANKQPNSRLEKNEIFQNDLKIWISPKIRESFKDDLHRIWNNLRH